MFRLLIILAFLGGFLYLLYLLVGPSFGLGGKKRTRPKRAPDKAPDRYPEGYDFARIELTESGFSVESPKGRFARAKWDEIWAIDIVENKAAVFAAYYAVECHGRGRRKWSIPFHAEGFEAFREKLTSLPEFDQDAFSNRKVNYPFLCWKRAENEV